MIKTEKGNGTLSIVEFIERKMKDIEPGLNPKDRARWLWGYHDALEDVLKEIKGGRK